MTDDMELRIEAYAQSMADAAPPMTGDQRTAVSRAVGAGCATEQQL